MKIQGHVSKLVMMALMSLSVTAAARAEDTIKIGIDAAYKPFAFVDATGQLSGFEVELTKAVCQKINARCEISNVPWDGIWTALEAGTIDMIGTTVTETAPRLKKYDVSSTIYKVGYAFIVPTTTSIPGGLNGLKGKSIGTITGTQNFYQYIRDTLGADTDIRGYDSPDAAVLDLDTGRIAAFQGDNLQMQSEFVSTGKYKYVDKINYGSNGAGLGRAWFFRKGSPELTAKINKGIAAAISDGTLDRLSNKYFGVKFASK